MPIGQRLSIMNRYTFEIRTQPNLCPLPCEDCTVVLEVPENRSLFDLATAILDSIGFDNDHAFGFLGDLENPHQSKESYTIFADMGDAITETERGVSSATVKEVFVEGKQMIFLFDYGDNWMFVVTCSSVTEAASSRRKAIRQVAINGTPPEQYPDFE